ncbi:hypothetical protein HK102_005542 [Quaeritorhiza haematococci]|nr:hypothetical protein HK102_005542 [Quaeritorhiza haematococci]
MDISLPPHFLIGAGPSLLFRALNVTSCLLGALKASSLRSNLFVIPLLVALLKKGEATCAAATTREEESGVVPPPISMYSSSSSLLLDLASGLRASREGGSDVEEEEYTTSSEGTAALMPRELVVELSAMTVGDVSAKIVTAAMNVNRNALRYRDAMIVM